MTGGGLEKRRLRIVDCDRGGPRGIVLAMVVPWHYLAELGSLEGASFALDCVLDLHVARLGSVVSDTRRTHRLILAAIVRLLRIRVDTLVRGLFTSQTSTGLLMAD